MFKWFRKHNCEKDGHCYEARYDIEPAVIPSYGNIEMTGVKMLEAFRRHIYIHDVCKHCGAVIERTKRGR